jgi:protein involved in polysaccharide export with SLBB domain
MISLPSAVINFVHSNFALSPMTRPLKYSLRQGRLRFGFHGKACSFLFVLLSFVSCETTVSTKFPEESLAQMPVTLSPGDVLKIVFPGAVELTQSQTIQADGKINLPYVGEVDAAGHTIGDLQRKLEALYKPQLQNTTVVVTLETGVTPVVIGGAVKKAGKYTFDRPTTVLQAIMEAGGTDQFGTLGKVSLIRVVNGQQRTEVLDLRPILQGQPTKPKYVHTGDIIVVGETVF